MREKLHVNGAGPSIIKCCVTMWRRTIENECQYRTLSLEDCVLSHRNKTVAFDKTDMLIKQEYWASYNIP